MGLSPLESEGSKTPQYFHSVLRRSQTTRGENVLVFAACLCEHRLNHPPRMPAAVAKQQKLFSEPPVKAEIVRVEKNLNTIGFFTPSSKKLTGISSKTVVIPIRTSTNQRVEGRAVEARAVGELHGIDRGRGTRRPARQDQAIAVVLSADGDGRDWYGTAAP